MTKTVLVMTRGRPYPGATSRSWKTNGPAWPPQS